MIHRCCTCCVSCAFVSIFGKICFQKNSFDSLGCWQVVKNSSIEGEERVTRNWPDVRTRSGCDLFIITDPSPIMAPHRMCIVTMFVTPGDSTLVILPVTRMAWLGLSFRPPGLTGDNVLLFTLHFRVGKPQTLLWTWECPVAESCYNVTTLLVLPGPLLSLSWVILK